METAEKSVTYQATNSYTTLNRLTASTEYIWMVFHGMGFLSRYFLRSFRDLDSKKHYIIAPQAPSKYYLNDQFKYVGASWLTKENTQTELGNIMNYVQAVYNAENLPDNPKLVVFGFSQGVSIVMRWVVKSQIACHRLILYAGGIPNEITKQHFDAMGFDPNVVRFVYGNQDQYLTEERMEIEDDKRKQLFGNHAKVVTFQGGHEIKPELLEKLY